MKSKIHEHRKDNKNSVSKNIFVCIVCFISTLLFAQENEPIAPKDYTVTMDSLLKYVKKDNMKTGILYDRVVANANLLEFNNKDSKLKSSYWHYIQALSEVHRSSLDPKNKMQYEIVEDLKHKNDNVLNITYINTNIDYIDFGTEKEPNLVFKDGFFYNIEGRNPFKQKQVTVVAAIVETIYSQEVKIRLNPDMMYQDDSNPIKNLTAIINGTEIKLVANFENLKDETLYKVTGDEKEMVFYIEFKDETKMQTRASINVSLPQLSNSSIDPCFVADFVGGSGIDRNSPENTISFQGYNETTPIKGVLEYRTYYNHTVNSCGNAMKINKPIIILDGFDPGDKRKIHEGSIGYLKDSKSLFELMVFDPDNNPLTENNQNFIDNILIPQGYDVTLVNFPENKVIDPVHPTRPVWVITNVITHQIQMPWPFQSSTITWYEEIGHWTTVINFLHLADGGADYIERNAMAVVALLKRENAKLADNGSTEQITLVGPSMGGLISRYALAYMEKNNIPHNVKLWVSFDSPHLGANIPLSTQAQLLFLGTTAESAEAYAKYKENLQSPAARQMLIEQIDNYPNTTSLGSNNNKNNNHPFRKQFLQNQITNSSPNSNGFPINMRKIALINGTTNGMKTNSEGQLVYDVAVFGSFNIKGFFNVDRNLASPGNSITSFEGRFTKQIRCSIPFTNMTYWCGLIITDQWRNDVNTNPQGCMDVVPGGTFNTVGIIKKSIDENPAIQEYRVENRVYVPNHAFIPTVSSLAFKNPNFDWSTPLNRNLICDPNNKEIPFDSYFSPSKNEEHVALTKESVDWLLSEIQGNPQAPRFDVNESALVGLKLICENQSSNYSFGTNVCKLPSLVQSWTVSSNTLQVLSSNGFDIIVKGIGSGQSTITATFQNGQTVTKNIWVGKPKFPSSGIVNGVSNTIFNQTLTYSYNGEFPSGATSTFQWYVSAHSNQELQGLTSAWQILSGQGTNSITVKTGSIETIAVVAVKVTNSCGADEKYMYVKIAAGGTNLEGDPCIPLLKIFPNPVKGNSLQMRVLPPADSCDSNQKVIKNTVKMFDFYGNLVYVNAFETDDIQIDNLNLKRGNYVLNVITETGKSVREIIIIE